MVNAKHLDLQSRVFSTGKFQSHIDFAVRGLPRVYLPNEQHVNYDWALEQFTPAILTLDRLSIDLAHFTRGVTGAAILMLTLEPETEDFWAALAEKQVHLDRDGFCAPGLLYYHLERCQSIESITRRSDYQLFLYQTALSLVSAWRYNRNPKKRYRKVPRTPDAAGLIEQVNRKLRCGNRMSGFRPTAVIRAHTHLIDPPRITHACDPATILELARRGGKILGDPPAGQNLAEGLEWVLELEPDAEISHPAALAAAAVAIARYPGSRSVWLDVFRRNGIWCPNADMGRQEANAAGLILRQIIVANRSSEPAQTALELFERALKACEMHESHGDIRRRIAPRISHAEELAESCREIVARIQPNIEFVTPYQQIEACKDPESEKRQAGGSRKLNRHAAGKRLQTGRIGERYFTENYAKVFPQFGDIELVDRRDHADGYDMLFLTETGEYIEVKTVRPDAQANISMTRRQWETALEQTTDYWLVLVILADPEPEMVVLQNPAAHLDPRQREVTTTYTCYEVSVAEILSLARSGQGGIAGPGGVNQRPDA